MAKAHRLYLGILSALALCKYSLEEWNATEEPANRTVSPCHHHSNRNNCTAADSNKDTGQWSGHFTKCPKALKHYCINGDCRYIEEQKVPSCRCEHGFIGSRCEYYDLGLQIGEQRQIIIACVITGLVFLILLIVFICMCSHRRYTLCKRRRRSTEEEPRNGTEKLNMMDTGGAHGTLMPDSTEHTNDL